MTKRVDCFICAHTRVTDEPGLGLAFVQQRRCQGHATWGYSATLSEFRVPLFERGAAICLPQGHRPVASKMPRSINAAVRPTNESGQLLSGDPRDQILADVSLGSHSSKSDVQLFLNSWSKAL
jgi:hypothetical protein